MAQTPPRERTLRALALLRERDEGQAQQALQRALAEQLRAQTRMQQAREALSRHRAACRESAAREPAASALTGFALQQAERHREGLRLRERALATRLVQLEEDCQRFDAQVQAARAQLAQRHAERRVVEGRRAQAEQERRHERREREA